MPITQNTAAARSMVNGFAGVVMKNDGEDATAPTNIMSQRTIELDLRWRYFRCTVYDGRKQDWDGTSALTDAEADSVATEGSVPDGYVDAGQAMPLKLRKPSAPHYLGRVIPQRFTSLLFGKKRCPKIVADDPDTSDWLEGFAKKTCLWSKMKVARNYGGGMGSAGIGYRFVNGVPVFEVFDPRWTEPEFSDRASMTLRKLTIQYQYPEWSKDSEGKPIQVWFWYRRVIDANTDTVWERVKPVPGEEPNWAAEPSKPVNHNLGEIPCEWIQNEPVDDDMDGDPDCHGCYDKLKRIDALWSQADYAIIYNCDPGTVVRSERTFPNGIKRGSGEAIQIEPGGGVDNLEMTGTGPKAATELAHTFEEQVLTMCRCVLENSHANATGADRTATEIERNFSAMIDRADDFRTQYGDALERLLEKVLRAAKKLSSATIGRDANGMREVQRQEIKLPKKRVVDEKDPKKVTFVERKLGNGEEVDLVWPDYFEPSLQDVALAVKAAGDAFKTYGMVDDEAAIRFIAQYLRLDDVPGILERIREKLKQLQEEQAKMAGASLDAASRSQVKTAA